MHLAIGFACFYYNTQLPAASVNEKEQIIQYISFLGHVKHHMHLATHNIQELRLQLYKMFTVCYHHREVKVYEVRLAWDRNKETTCNMYIQYYNYANVILILTVHGINCKDEREGGKSVIMNPFRLSIAVRNVTKVV